MRLRLAAAAGKKGNSALRVTPESSTKLIILLQRTMGHRAQNLTWTHPGGLIFIAVCLVTLGALVQQQLARPYEHARPCIKPPNDVAGIHASVLVDGYQTLYAKHAAQWLAVKDKLTQFCQQTSSTGKRPSCLSDDLEMEMSYFRLRAFRPKLVWEISPADGFSTLMILSALADNGDGGKLVSFDVRNSAESFVPAEFRRKGRWELRVGDVRRLNLSNEHLPDYLFLDSWHSYEMAQFYTTKLLPSFKPKHVPVSLHDAYNPSFWVDGGEGRDVSVYPAWMPNAEAIVVIDWLKDQPYLCGAYSISKHHTPADVYDAHLEMRRRAFGQEASARGIRGDFTSDQPNPTLYFELNCPLRSWCKL